MSKKIKNLKGLSYKAGNSQGNRVKPVNVFIPFEKEDIHRSVPERFETMVKKYPGKTAVKTINGTITYDALNKKANRIAHAILQKKPSHVTVALLLDGDIDKIAGILGVLKSGNIYVPLDTNYPPDRLEYMLKDSNARLIVTDGDNIKLKAGPANEIEVIDIEALPGEISGENPGVNIHPSDPAYILYTSGSTGKPKGVLQNHRNVLHHARVYTNALHIHKDDKLTLFSSYSFDAAKMDIYGALLNGASLYPYDIKAGDNLRRLPRWVREEGITVFHSIPTVYRYFTDMLTENEPDRFPALRFIVLGGEAVFKKDFDNYKRYFEDRCLFINGLGPTESTVTVQYFMDRNTEISREAVPVGHPVDETRVYLLNESGKETGMFGVGEIVFKSDYLAAGYVNKPLRTRRAFTVDPVTGNGRVYRTGDLGRRLPGGAIEYAGRKDFQVKVSGYRIELGEVEGKLDRAAGIEKSVVVCSQDRNNENFLAAYYTQTGEKPVDETELAKGLNAVLPAYMIPSVFISLPEFPLTPTGKIDRKTLSRRDVARLLRREEREAPGNETERGVLKLWKEILKQEIIGVNENFFVLGGNSIKAVLLVSRLHKELGVEISIAEIFKSPTVKELAKHIANAGASIYKTIYKPIEPVEKSETYPLSSAQERLFFLNRFEMKSTRFNIPVALSINGPLDMGRYTFVIKALIRRHDALRTSFHAVGDRSVQRVHDNVDFEIEHTGDVAGEFLRPFDLSRAPLFRVGVFSRSEYEHRLLFDIHHIIFDGASMGVLIDDFMRLYNGETLTPLGVRYIDFVAWQRGQFESGIIKKAGDYWLDLYSDAVDGEVPRLNLPADFPRPRIMSYEGDGYRFSLDGDTARGLKKLALENDVTLFMVLLAIYNVFLSKLSGREDIISAVVVSGRNHADTERLIGVFINMLALRNFPRKETPFLLFLEEVGKSTAAAFENRDYPFEELIEKLPGSRDVSRHPLADVGFTLQNAGTGMDTPHENTDSELRLVSLKSERKSARNDLNLEAFEIGDRLELEFQYRTGLFKEETIIGFSTYLKTLISEIPGDPAQKIGDMDLLTGEEKERLLVTFNRTEKEYPGGQTVFQLFEGQVERDPGAIAVRSTVELQNIYDQLKAEDIEVELTYEELNGRANRLAYLLRARGVRRDNIVGLLVRHPLEKVVGIWGILKSGGAYLPIDPTYPAMVIDDILDDSGVPLLVSETELEEMLSKVKIPPCTSVIHIDDPGEDYAEENPEPVCGLSDLAYVIYTSGTTGKARGAAIEHRGIVNYARWRVDYFDFSAGDVTLQPLTYSFDSFCANFYACFLSGGELVMVPDNRRIDFDYIAGMVKEYRVTTVCFAPGLYNALLDTADGEGLASLRLAVLAGDVCGPSLVEKSREKAPRVQLANEYGPTEGTVAATAHNRIDVPVTTVIGRPISNAKIFILDGSFKPVLPGTAGEIFIAGTGLARGYLNRPELTAERFYRSYKTYKSYRTYVFYRTGDLGRWLPDGTVDFLGRKDFQVKIRGHRIELEQIESVLTGHPGIDDVLVTAAGEGESKYLCAYIATRGPAGLNTAALKDYLRERLPYYMMPSYFVPLEKMPLTSNGKIDRKALPRPETGKTGEEYVPPSNTLEEQIAGALKEVLHLDRVGINDNFFDIGGNSLNLVQVNGKLKELTGKEIPVVTIFQYPTIRSLSRFLSNGDSGQEHEQETLKRTSDAMEETVGLFENL